MRKLYIDASLSVSGDMLLGALTGLGVKLNDIKTELKKLKIKDYTISTKKDMRHSISGLKLTVRCKESKHHRTYKDIQKLIKSSQIDKEVKDLSLKCFHLIAEAEAAVHHTNIDNIHFHEVGAVDSIVDIVGVMIAFTILKDKYGHMEVCSSPLNPGLGTVKTQHGLMPVPAPATLLLLKNIPLVTPLVCDEVSTPTGVAIIKTLTGNFGPMPAMTIDKTSIAIGHKDFKEAPNLLRLMLSEDSNKSDYIEEDLMVMETNIDDMTAELLSHLAEELLSKGALDAFLTPVIMKKGRPGHLLTVLCEPTKAGLLKKLIFTESTTIGIRTYHVNRSSLQRESVQIKTKYGEISVKTTLCKGKIIGAKPEFEDVKKAAKKHKKSLKTVMLEATFKASTLID